MTSRAAGFPSFPNSNPFAGEPCDGECEASAGFGRRRGAPASALVIAAFALAAAPALAQSSTPDPRTTPGALNPQVTQNTIASTICAYGWARSIRPPEPVTYAIKRQQLRAMGFDHAARDFEEDHLVPLSLGGSPDAVANLWPEPRDPPDGWGADRKDELEGVLNHLVCSRQLALDAARAAIASDWRAAYRTYVGAGGR